MAAIGHEIDRSIADIVAFHSCKTPTAAAEFLIARLDEAADRLTNTTEQLRYWSKEVLTSARQRMQENGNRLEIQVGRRVGRAREALANRRSRMAAAAARLMAKSVAEFANLRLRLAEAVTRRSIAATVQLAGLENRLVPARLLMDLPHHNQRLSSLTSRLGRSAFGVLLTAKRRIDHGDDRTRLLDPERLLTRGYTLTMDAAGCLVKSARGLKTGDAMRTRFRDGEVDSVIAGTSAKRRTGPTKPSDGGKGDRRGREKTKPKQKSLFR